MRFYHRLRTKLALSFLAIALLPVFIVGSYSLQFSSDLLISNERAEETRRIDEIRANIVRFLRTARGDIQFLSSSAPLDQLLAQDKNSPQWSAARRQVEKEFLSFAKSRRIYYQLRYLNEEGQEIVRVDTNRRGVSRIIPEEELQNKGGRYYFQDSVNLRPGQLFVSPLDLNREHGQIEKPFKPVIRYALAVRYPDRSPAGIVISNIQAQDFLDMIDKNTMMIDQNGYYLAHPDPAKRWGSERDLNHQHNFKKDYPEKAVHQIMNTGQGVIDLGDKILSYVRVDVPSSDQYWVLVSEASKERLLASVNQFRKTWGIIASISILVALLLAFYIEHRISKPIEYLTQAAERASMGDLNQPIQIKSEDEIGQLAKAFERMRISMLKMMDRMKKK